MLLSCRLSKRFKEEEHKCTGRAAYDDLISRMHSGLQETLEEIEQLPMSEQASFHVMRVQNGASAVFVFVLDSKGNAHHPLLFCIRYHHSICLAGQLLEQLSNSVCTLTFCCFTTSVD